MRLSLVRWCWGFNRTAMQIKTLEISGIVPSLQAMRLPKASQPHSWQHVQNYGYKTDHNGYYISQQIDSHIANADLELAQRLVRAGDEHAKAIRGIIVWVEIVAPIYWWREMETYRAGRERLSCESTMHIDCKGLTGEELVQAKAEIPMGKEQAAVDCYSYQCLRRIYHQRKNHRLPQWQEFCKWIESLPFAPMLITC